MLCFLLSCSYDGREDRGSMSFQLQGEFMLQQEGYNFMAAAFEVYNEIGYGMAEEIYQQSLEIELSLRKIPFLTKQELEVYYKGHKLTTCYKPDLLVFGSIVVELKAVTELLQEHEAQLFNYMRISRMTVG
jgi:GxxExxY protein